jgi:hypothetical protein
MTGREDIISDGKNIYYKGWQQANGVNCWSWTYGCSSNNVYLLQLIPLL